MQLCKAQELRIQDSELKHETKKKCHCLCGYYYEEWKGLRSCMLLYYYHLPSSILTGQLIRLILCISIKTTCIQTAQFLFQM